MSKSNQYVCSSCGYNGYPKKVTKGSFLIEIVLWLAFLLPGLLYSIWRLASKQTVCPKCRHETMIPLNTPKGQEMFKKYVLSNDIEKKKCPFCAEEIQNEAIKCKHCSSDLPVIEVREEVEEANEQVDESTETKKKVVLSKRGKQGLIILVLVILTPLLWFFTIPGISIWFIWKKTTYSKKIKAALSGLVIIAICGLYALYFDSVPTITITEPKENFTMQTNVATIKGKVEPITSVVKVNNHKIETNNGEFSFEAALNVGHNEYNVVANNDSKRTSEKVTIVRTLTEEELAEKERQNAEVKQKQEAAQREAEEKKAAEQTAREAEWNASKAGQICNQHTEWTKDDCISLADNKIWIGMSYEMLVYSMGNPDSTNVSNYGSGSQYQYCWHDYTSPSCFYDNNDDGIIDSYN